MELGIPSSTHRAVFQLVPGASRKRRGDVSGIRRAQPRAAAASEAIHVEACKDRARARHSTSGRDCACVRTCGRSTQSRRHLSDAKVIVSATNGMTVPILDISDFESCGRAGAYLAAATKYTCISAVTGWHRERSCWP